MIYPKKSAANLTKTFWISVGAEKRILRASLQEIEQGPDLWPLYIPGYGNSSIYLRIPPLTSLKVLVERFPKCGHRDMRPPQVNHLRKRRKYWEI
jgi:hypothetical protein